MEPFKNVENLDVLLKKYNPIKIKTIHQISNAVILAIIEKTALVHEEGTVWEVDLSIFGLFIGLILLKFHEPHRKKMLGRVNQLLDARTNEGNFKIFHILPAPDILRTIQTLLSEDNKFNINTIHIDRKENNKQDLLQYFSNMIDQITQQFDQRIAFYQDLLFFFLIDITHFMLIMGFSKRTRDKYMDIDRLAQNIREYIYKASGYAEIQLTANTKSIETVH